MCNNHTMIKIVKKLKSNSSRGPDMLTPYFIATIASPLCKLCNECLEDYYVPTDWKKCTCYSYS